MKNRSRVLAATFFLSSSAFLAGACTFKEGTFDGFGGEGGGGGETSSGGSSSGGATGGAPTGGTSTGGAQGGMGGTEITLDCSDDGSVLGKPGVKPDSSDTCLSCLYDLCKPAYENCYATAPVTACTEADIPTTFDGSEIVVSGEFTCVWACMQDSAANDPGYVGDYTDVDNCLTLCGASECDRSDAAGVLTKDLGYCMIGLDGDGDPLDPAGECVNECGVAAP